MLRGYCVTNTSAARVRGHLQAVIIPGGVVQIHADSAEAR
ncbi:MAG: hypothetical protein RIT02_1093 [Planctomycetota bacterium]